MNPVEQQAYTLRGSLLPTLSAVILTSRLVFKIIPISGMKLAYESCINDRSSILSLNILFRKGIYFLNPSSKGVFDRY
jgi:hypothetical protein